jgi:para-nitrobenzyl esterase
MFLTDRRTVLVGLSSTLATAALAQSTPVVETASGKLQGLVKEGAVAFFGIPYAAPPLGPLRYRAPQPAAPWAGIRDAGKPGAASIQTLAGAAAWLYEGADPQSEDCLFLNVWTPSAQGKRPVMVWLHGGAWRTGHGLVAGTNGAALAVRGDVVVVTVNYRLGALGWLSHPELKDERSGTLANWGHQDQIAALRWVKDNIAAFGGDPARVTIFGQSAGGQSVATIAQNPANAGLFDKVIIQSGSLHGAPGFPELDTAAAYAEALAKRLGTSIAGLRELPAQQLHDAELQLARDPAMVRSLGRPPILPVLDGKVLTAWPRDGQLPAVPALIGTTRDEGVFWYDLVNPDGKAVGGLKSPQTEAELQAMIRDLIAIYRPEAAHLPVAEIVEAYRSTAAPAESDALKSSWIAAYGDIVFRLRALEAARRHARAGHAVYLYEFDHPLAPPARGVPHTAEIPFVFGTYRHPFFSAKVGAGQAEARLSELMLASWASFAHTGTPASDISGAWRPVSPDGKGINLLGRESGYKLADAVQPERTAAWRI